MAKLRKQSTEPMYSPYKTDTAKLVLHKDNINTINYVMYCLSAELGIHSTNAEQLVILMSYKGKVTILTSDEETVRIRHARLNKMGLYTTIVE